MADRADAYDEGVPGADPGDGELPFEDAWLLLDEFREFVDETEPGAGGEDEQVRDQMERLLASLRALPLPRTFGEERMEEIASWTGVLIVEGGHQRQGGPEQIRALLRDELAELRERLDEEVEEG